MHEKANLVNEETNSVPAEAKNAETEDDESFYCSEASTGIMALGADDDSDDSIATLDDLLLDSVQRAEVRSTKTVTLLCLKWYAC